MLVVNFHPFPVLETSRLLLRQIAPADAEAIFQLRSDELVMQYIDRPRAKTQDEALQLIRTVDLDWQKNQGITWGIAPKGEDSLAGTIGFWRLDKPNHRAEIGYMLHAAYQRRGLMQEAIGAVIAFGFNQVKLHSIEANVNPANDASIALLEKNKFVKEAYFRENYYYDGKFLDSAIYCLLTTKK